MEKSHSLSDILERTIYKNGFSYQQGSHFKRSTHFVMEWTVLCGWEECVTHGSTNQELGFVHICPSRGCSVSKAWGEENRGPWGTTVIHAEGVEKWC